mgnify:CR=1 FL=1
MTDTALFVWGSIQTLLVVVALGLTARCQALTRRCLDHLTEAMERNASD